MPGLGEVLDLAEDGDVARRTWYIKYLGKY
jgi:hypothetical protein